MLALEAGLVTHEVALLAVLVLHGDSALGADAADTQGRGFDVLTIGLAIVGYRTAVLCAVKASDERVGSADLLDD